MSVVFVLDICRAGFRCLF